MKKLRDENSKLDKKQKDIEAYIAGLYFATYPKPVESTFEKEQSFLQVPLSEAKILEMLVRLVKPKKVLEIGTFRGFSSVFLAKSLKSGHLWTIERDKQRYEDIEKLFKDTKVSKKVTLIKDFALPALKQFKKEKKTFDFFFIDASKQETKKYFLFCYKHLSKKNAVFVIDNVLWAGEVTESNPTSNAAKHMKEFNEFLFSFSKKNAYILPAWDGVALVLKEK